MQFPADNILFIGAVIIVVSLCALSYVIGKDRGEDKALQSKKQQEAIQLWNEILKKYMGGRNE